MCVWNLIQRHTIELDGVRILSLVEENVADVDSQTTSVAEHLVFHNHIVSVVSLMP